MFAWGRGWAHELLCVHVRGGQALTLSVISQEPTTLCSEIRSLIILVSWNSPSRLGNWSPPLQCWDYKCLPPGLVLGIKLRASFLQSKHFPEGAIPGPHFLRFTNHAFLNLPTPVAKASSGFFPTLAQCAFLVSE